MEHTFMVRSIMQEDDGGYALLLEQKLQVRPKKGRKERWASSDDWAPSDCDDYVPYSMAMRSRTGRAILTVPISAREMQESGIVLGSEVQIHLQAVGHLVR